MYHDVSRCITMYGCKLTRTRQLNLILLWYHDFVNSNSDFTNKSKFIRFFQGCNARKVYTSFVLQCTSLGGNVNTRRMSKPEMGSIFHIKNRWNILVIGNYYVNYQNFQNLMLLTSSDTKQTLMHLVLFTNSAQRELYVRRVYRTVINFPCIF